MTHPYRVLLVDDDYKYAALVCEFLLATGVFTVDLAMDIQDMWDHLAASSYDVMLLADQLSNGHAGGDILAQLSARGVVIPVVMIGGGGDERAGVQAMQQGAADYVIKRGDFLASLPVLLPKAVQAHRAQLVRQQAFDRARLLLDSLPDALVAWDPQGRIVAWNQKAEALYGWTGADRLGRDARQCYLCLFTPPLGLPADDGSPQTVLERRVRTRREEVIRVTSRLVAVRNAGGQVTAYMHISYGNGQAGEGARGRPGSESGDSK